MRGDLDHLASAVARLARATASAHDPSGVVSGLVEALDPVVPIGSATLWLGSGPHDQEAVSHPDGAVAAPGARGCHTVALRGIGWQVGHLVVCPAPGTSFDDGGRALLEVAATQVAGALERARLYAEVFELERLKSDFIARVSHELRTPITIITGFLDTLVAHDGRLDGDQRRHMLDRSSAAAARLSRLIEELLVLSRMEAGVLTPEIAPVDLDELFAEVRASASEPDQVVIVPGRLGPVPTDGALLTRVLGLLVDNALKYGGTAEVSVVPIDAPAPVGPGNRTAGPGNRTGTGPGAGPGGAADHEAAALHWQIDVRDRGAGFEPDIRSTAFEMFTRGANTTSVPGLGAGLPIARTIVEVLAGTLEIADPAEGPGAVLRIRLP